MNERSIDKFWNFTQWGVEKKGEVKITVHQKQMSQGVLMGN